MSNDALSHLALGKNVEYATHYDASLLQQVPRALGRDNIGLQAPLPFKGCDMWNGYELSWLNAKGKPQVAILQCTIPCTSEYLIESKSFKLYLNSFNQSRFDSVEKVRQTLTRDLSQCAGEAVDTRVILPGQFNDFEIADLQGQSIDDIDIEIDTYDIDPASLTTGNEWIRETLTSNLLKSNCLITNQPDWASISIQYHGPKINQEALLRYLISFRMHNEFHEQCVERIFHDINTHCEPEELTVYARYTRRGGLDINPYRSTTDTLPNVDVRQARQ